MGGCKLLQDGIEIELSVIIIFSMYDCNVGFFVMDGGSAEFDGLVVSDHSWICGFTSMDNNAFIDIIIYLMGDWFIKGSFHLKKSFR